MTRAIVVVVALTVASSTARAQPSMTPPAPALETPPEPDEPEHYGVQIFGADVAVGATCLLVGVGTQRGEVFVLWLGGYVLTGPIVHAYHGEAGHALLSGGLRLGLPILGAKLGYELDEGDGDSELDGLGGLFAGAAAGMITALVIDWAALGHESRREPARAQPYVAPAQGGATLGFAGAW